jgi:hypothetical protein
MVSIASLIESGMVSQAPMTLARSAGISVGLFDTHLTRFSCKEVFGVCIGSVSFCTEFKLGELGKVLDCKGFATLCAGFVADMLFCKTARLRVRFPPPPPFFSRAQPLAI